jgi:hypothetical protein
MPELPVPEPEPPPGLDRGDLTASWPNPAIYLDPACGMCGAHGVVCGRGPGRAGSTGLLPVALSLCGLVAVI